MKKRIWSFHLKISLEIIYFDLSILNSSSMWFFIKNTSPVLRGGFRQFKTSYLKPFPLPILKDIEEQKPFIEKADFMIEKNKQFYEAKKKFIKLVKYKYNLDKTSRKLDTFYNLNFKEFVNEIQDKNKVMSIEQESELMDFFEKNKKEILKIREDINKTDEEINKMVYKLYELNPAEIKIIEESLK